MNLDETSVKSGILKDFWNGTRKMKHFIIYSGMPSSYAFWIFFFFFKQIRWLEITSSALKGCSRMQDGQLCVEGAHASSRGLRISEAQL